MVAYGDDDYTAATRERFREHFGEQAEPFLVFNGTGANVLALDALTRPHEGVICTEIAHLHVDECGAPERLAGVKLLTVPTADGKLTPEPGRGEDTGVGDEHESQPRVVSITQSTELGTVYTPEETGAIADAAHELEMYLHVDGARLANAAASLDLPLRALTTDAGVDVLSFGGTKNGLLLGDAVVFLRPELARDFRFTRKQSAARLEDAVPRRPVRRPARRRPVAPQRLPRERDGAAPRRRDLRDRRRRARLPGAGERRLRHPARRRRSSACATRSRPRCPSTSGTRPPARSA